LIPRLSASCRGATAVRPRVAGTAAHRLLLCGLLCLPIVLWTRGSPNRPILAWGRCAAWCRIRYLLVGRRVVRVGPLRWGCGPWRGRRLIGASRLHWACHRRHRPGCALVLRGTWLRRRCTGRLAEPHSHLRRCGPRHSVNVLLIRVLALVLVAEFVLPVLILLLALLLALLLPVLVLVLALALLLMLVLALSLLLVLMLVLALLLVLVLVLALLLVLVLVLALLLVLVLAPALLLVLTQRVLLKLALFSTSPGHSVVLGGGRPGNRRQALLDQLRCAPSAR